MASGDDRICAVVIDIDHQTKRATNIEPVIYPPFPNTAELWAEARKAEARKAEELAKAEAEAKALAEAEAKAQAEKTEQQA